MPLPASATPNMVATHKTLRPLLQERYPATWQIRKQSLKYLFEINLTVEVYQEFKKKLVSIENQKSDHVEETFAGLRR
ncbi:hypothetical protein ABFY27_10240 [Akkermansia massiliensis]